MLFYRFCFDFELKKKNNLYLVYLEFKFKYYLCGKVVE